MFKIGDRVTVIDGEYSGRQGRIAFVGGEDAVMDSMIRLGPGQCRVGLDGEAGGVAMGRGVVAIGGRGGASVIFNVSQLRVDVPPMSDAAIQSAVTLAEAYLTGGDTPPFRADTTAVIARALVELAKRKADDANAVEMFSGPRTSFERSVWLNAEPNKPGSTVSIPFALRDLPPPVLGSLETSMRVADTISKKESAWLDMAIQLLMVMGYGPMELHRLVDRDSDGTITRSVIHLGGKPVFEVATSFAMDEMKIKIMGRLLPDWPREPKESSNG